MTDSVNRRRAAATQMRDSTSPRALASPLPQTGRGWTLDAGLAHPLRDLDADRLAGQHEPGRHRPRAPRGGRVAGGLEGRGPDLRRARLRPAVPSRAIARATRSSALPRAGRLAMDRAATPRYDALAMATPRGMVPADLTRIRFVSDARVSPDGRVVAFVVTTLSEERDEYLSQIWLVDTAGGEPRRFTAGPRRDTAPRWSPDGTRLAFVSEREAKKKGQLYVMPVAGGEPTRLTDLRHGVSATRVVARRDAAGLRLARGRLGGARVRGGEAEVAPPARHHHAQVPVQRRGLHLRPAAADLHGGRRRRRAPPGDRGRLRPRGSGLVARRPRARLRLRAPRRARPRRRERHLGGRRGGRRAATADRHDGPAGHPAFSPAGDAVAYLGAARAATPSAATSGSSPFP